MKKYSATASRLILVLGGAASGKSQAALDRAGGDRREAAQALGMSLATLYRRVERLGLKRVHGDGDGDPPTSAGDPRGERS